MVILDLLVNSEWLLTSVVSQNVVRGRILAQLMDIKSEPLRKRNFAVHSFARSAFALLVVDYLLARVCFSLVNHFSVSNTTMKGDLGWDV